MTSPLTLRRPPCRAARRAAADERFRLTVPTGLAALSLDAMASVAYGPEAIVLVLALAGSAGLGFTLPVTAAIALLLVVLTVSYRQVIAAFPDGGGAYGVAKAHLGRIPALTAAASLVVDYVLNVAVSVSAGVAALTSTFPVLLPYAVVLCLAVLLLITAVNLRGITESARAFVVPTVVFVVGVLAVIIVGLVRREPVVLSTAPASAPVETVGLLLLLRAFANGCASLTGVEAIANAVPSFRTPRVRRAQTAEVVLGGLLGVLLIGMALVIQKFGIHPVDGTTVLSQVTEASFGHGVLYFIVSFSTVILLALAANTSFGGLPVLASLLAQDNALPHLFALQAERRVHRYGIGFLAVSSAVLLVVAGGQVNVLVPLFAIGVFVGFTLSQTGMVRHWLRDRPPGWRGKLTVNALGALLTGVAAVIVTATKFGEGGWLVVVTLPLLVLGMDRVERAYARIGARLELGKVPSRPVPHRSLVIVPVSAVSLLTREALSAALSLGDRVEAVHVTTAGDDASREEFLRQWRAWDPPVSLRMLDDPHRRLAEPLVTYLASVKEQEVFVVIAEVEPEHLWQRLLQNQRGAVLDRALRRRSRAVVCRLRFRV